MNRVSQRYMAAWVRLGPRFLPFADAASPDLPLSRLIRLSLVQVAVGMSLVLLVGTLNRVMIVELDIPASLVSTMIALPVLFAPFRALIGHRSDTYRSVLGWRRVPFLFRGTMIQFGGLAIMPFAILVLSGGGESARFPVWIGHVGAAVAFLLVGAGIHTTQTVGLALATDLSRPEQRPNVVGLMYVMLLLGSIASALAFGWALEDFSPGRLVQVIQASAVVTIVLNAVALWKQESRRRGEADRPSDEPGFSDALALYMNAGQALRRLVAVGLGTMAFGMQDVLLEPYGATVLGQSVSETTRLTATLAAGGLLGFSLASHVLSRGADPIRMAASGAAAGALAFAGVMAAGPAGSTWLFVASVGLIGFGGGLFGHGTLTATMNLAPPAQAGLALGAWGAVQATAAGVGIAVGGLLRDLLGAPARTLFGPAGDFTAVFALEFALLAATLLIMLPLLPGSATDLRRGGPGRQGPRFTPQTRTE
ncbi:PucC family protein [Prosthecomicrobium sp. N25]|uniref:PucC family protein n=1 Tax=Prosthecomicrobium sp. N25 TaxID=3129254 RepID=UPI003076FBF2